MEKRTLESFKKDEILDIERVIEYYNSYIYRLLKNNISNEMDIEEILSDVFMIFWKNHKNLDNTIDVKAYLIGITRNLIKKKYRKNYSINIKNVELIEDTLVSDFNIVALAESKEKARYNFRCFK